MEFCDFDHARRRRSVDYEGSADDEQITVTFGQVVQNSRIVSGTAIDGATVQMAWVVRLEFADSNGNIQRCAGTVVHRNWILTTRDCCQVKKMTH